MNRHEEIIILNQILAHMPTDGMITNKEFKAKYNLSIPRTTKPTKVEKFTLHTHSDKGNQIDIETIINQVYEVLTADGKWVKLTTKNMKKYIEKYGRSWYQWKKGYDIRLQVKKYYYNYTDLADGIAAKKVALIQKEQDKIISLQNRVCKEQEKINDLNADIEQIKSFLANVN